MRLVPIYLWVYLKRTLAAFRRIPEKMVGRLSALKHNRTIKYSAADFDYKDCNFLLNLLFPWNDLFFASSSFRYYWTNRKRIINAFPRRKFFLWKELLVAPPQNGQDKFGFGCDFTCGLRSCTKLRGQVEVLQIEAKSPTRRPQLSSLFIRWRRRYSWSTSIGKQPQNT